MGKVLPGKGRALPPGRAPRREQKERNADCRRAETEQKPGLMAQSEGGVTVVLDTNLTDDLVLEGYARELISKVQTLRKESGLELTDRIRLTVGGSKKVAKALNACREMIQRAVLADDLSATETADDAVKETDLNGEKVTLRVEKV